ncbi:Phosphopantetheine attachment site, partial [Nitrosovibrio sp. Nv17]
QDNFFELGGDSILSLQIVARLRRAGWKVTPRQLFERQSVMSLAGVAERADAADAAAGPSQAPASGAVPLLPIQAEFLESDIPARHHWNQAILLQIRGVLDPARLARALDAVVRHHDALRMRYAQDAQGQWRQAYGAPGEVGEAELLWVRRADTPAAAAALCEAAQRSLDLERGPLLRALALELPGSGASGTADASGTAATPATPASQWRLLLAIHHLVIDGVSWRILLEDLQSAYACAQDRAIDLPHKTSAYQAWGERLQAYPDAHPDEAAWWERLADVPAHLPCDWPDGADTFRHHVGASVTLDRAATQRLLKDAPAAYRTQVNDLLLTALGRALCAWSGHARILIDLEGHGREDLHDDLDLSRTVGWFTSLYPILLDPQGEPGAALKRVKEDLRRIPRRGIGYGLLSHL